MRKYTNKVNKNVDNIKWENSLNTNRNDWNYCLLWIFLDDEEILVEIMLWVLHTYVMLECVIEIE